MVGIESFQILFVRLFKCNLLKSKSSRNFDNLKVACRVELSPMTWRMLVLTDRKESNNIAGKGFFVEVEKIINALDSNRKTVVIQGIGFVGAAMLAAVSNVRDARAKPMYNVVGVDLSDQISLKKIENVNKGIAPISSSDKTLEEAYADAHAMGNLFATSDPSVFEMADVIVVDINLDIHKIALGDAVNYRFSFESYMGGLQAIMDNVSEDTLIIIESTVPPGTTQKVIFPFIQEMCSTRSIDPEKIYLAHSYERVMPGSKYLDSIINYYRVYSGINDQSKDKAHEFLSSFINTSDYPLRRLGSTTASEMSKVLENSYRAMNIAFIQEWTEYAEVAGVDLFEVIDAIRDRPTHKNIMAPGFGVGGYCLTKDALLADYGYNKIFKSGKRLSMSIRAVDTNDLMPKHSFELFEKQIKNLETLNVAILGVSYLNDVGDTRYTPLGLFYDLISGRVNKLILFDPYVEFWAEKDLAVSTELYHEPNVNCIVLTVRHKQYGSLNVDDIKANFPSVEYIFDANNVLSEETTSALIEDGKYFFSVGRGN